MGETLVWLKNGGAVKQAPASKVKQFEREGYEQGNFVKGEWVPKEQSDLKKQNAKLVKENTKLVAELAALKK